MCPILPHSLHVLLLVCCLVFLCTLQSLAICPVLPQLKHPLSLLFLFLLIFPCSIFANLIAILSNLYINSSTASLFLSFTSFSLINVFFITGLLSSFPCIT